MSRVLAGSCKEEWKENVSAVRNFKAGILCNQNKFQMTHSRIQQGISSRKCTLDQEESNAWGKIALNGHDHCKIDKRLFIINQCLELFSPQATNFLISEMAEEVVPNTLKSEACLNIIWQRGSKLMKREIIIDMGIQVSIFLNSKHNVKWEQKLHSNNNNCPVSQQKQYK